jgi:hypothetical protein
VLFLRIVLVWSIAVSSASAAEWQNYTNKRFGYSLDIAPGFTLEHEADNDDGRTFTAKNGDRMRVFAIALLDAFESEASNRIVSAMDNGWEISYSRVEADRAIFSGTKGDRILYVYGTQLCTDSAVLAMFEYRKRDIKIYDPIIKRVAKSMKTACPQ